MCEQTGIDYCFVVRFLLFDLILYMVHRFRFLSVRVIWRSFTFVDHGRCILRQNSLSNSKGDYIK